MDTDNKLSDDVVRCGTEPISAYLSIRDALEAEIIRLLLPAAADVCTKNGWVVRQPGTLTGLLRMALRRGLMHRDAMPEGSWEEWGTRYPAFMALVLELERCVRPAK